MWTANLGAVGQAGQHPAPGGARLEEGGRSWTFMTIPPLRPPSNHVPLYCADCTNGQEANFAALTPEAWHRTDRYANNHIEADHGRLKARLGPMRGLKQDRSATVVIAGHALVQNLRRRHYELRVEEPVNRRVAVAFDELALVI